MDKYHEYDEASKEVLSCFAGKAKSVRWLSEQADRLFRESFDSSGAVYSAENAAKWLSTIKPDVQHNLYKMCRQCQFRIAEKIFTDRTQYHIVLFYSDYLSESSLPSDWKELVEAFMSDRLWMDPKSFVHAESAAVVFLTDMISMGVNSLDEIDWGRLIEYKNDEHKHKTYNMTSAFLHFLADRNLIWHYATALYNHPIERLELYKGRCSDVVPTHSIDEVQHAECRLLSDMREAGYTKTPLRYTENAIDSFVLFLLMNDTAYSPEAAEAYSTLYIERINNHKRYIMRPLLLLAGYLEGKNINDMSGVCTAQKPAFPEWFAPYAEAFEKSRRLNHIGDSACIADRSALKSFAKYLDDRGCRVIEDISRQLLKDFNIADIHESHEGKSLYTARIRFFITFLYDSGYIPEDIGNALPKVNTAKRRPTRVLTDGQYSALLDYCAKAETEGNWRDAAILKIALWTGLRGCDISKLGADEIDWDNMEFSLIQQKTLVHIRIPFPVEVGNAIWMYISENRPSKCPDGFVFCQNKAPFHPLTRRVLDNIIHKALPGENVTFHMLRKTFATRLLRSGAKVSDVSDALGHVSDDTVDTYIDTNCDMMRNCALSLDGIEYKGAEV